MERSKLQRKKFLDQLPVESMRRFLDSRHALNRTALSRSIAFSRRIIDRCHQLPTTNLSAFLEYLFGKRSATSDMPGFRGSLVHRGLGNSLHQSFYTWFIESALSLTINKLEQCFGIWLNQVRTQQTLLNLENKIHLALQPQMNQVRTQQTLLNLENKIHFVLQLQTPGAAQKVFLSQPVHMTSAPPGSYEVLRIVKSTQAVSAIERSGSVALLQAPDVLHAIERSVQAIYSNRPDRLRKHEFSLPSFQTIQPLLTIYAAKRADEIRREFGTPVINLPASRSRVFVASQYGAEHPDSPQPRIRLWKEYGRGMQDSYRETSLEMKALAFSARSMAEKIEAMYLANPLVGPAASSRMTYVYHEDGGGYYRFPKAEFVSRSGMSPDSRMRTPASLHHLKSASGKTRRGQAAQQPGTGREPFSLWGVALTNEKWFEQKKRTHLSFIDVKTASARPANSILLKAERRGEGRDITENIFAPLLNGKLVARTVPAYAPLTEGQQSRVINELSFIRKEEQMRPPMATYTFALPARSTLIEEQVVRHEQEKEVVKIVRKEMETLMKSRSPMTELSRFDYSRITDRIWFSLSRRLMMEKERLGPR